MINLGSFAIDGTYNKENLKYYSGEYKVRTTVAPGDLVLANTDMTQDRVVLRLGTQSPRSFRHNFIHSPYLRTERIKTSKRISFLSFKTSTVSRTCPSKFATGTTVLFMPSEAITKLDFRMPDDQAMNDFVKIAVDLFDRKELIRQDINPHHPPRHTSPAIDKMER